jgi:hypothetical protein
MRLGETSPRWYRIRTPSSGGHFLWRIMTSNFRVERGYATHLRVKRDTVPYFNRMGMLAGEVLVANEPTIQASFIDRKGRTWLVDSEKLVRPVVTLTDASVRIKGFDEEGRKRVYDINIRKL